MKLGFELSLTSVLALNLYLEVANPTVTKQVCILNESKVFTFTKEYALKKKIPHGLLSLFFSMKMGSIHFHLISVIKKPTALYIIHFPSKIKIGIIILMPFFLKKTFIFWKILMCFRMKV